MENNIDRIPFLDDENVRLIHDKSVELLSSTGYRFAGSDRALEIFKRNGFKTDGDVVFFDEEKIGKAISTVPSSFRVRALNPENDFELGDGKFGFSNNAAPAFILDTDGTRREAVREDYIRFLKIAQQLDAINLVRPMWDVKDKPGGHFSWMIRWGLEYTDRVISGSSLEDIELVAMAFCLDKKRMREQAAGGVSHMIGLCSPRSPLTLERGNCDFVIDQADSGSVCKISPVPMAGMTGPITLPGLIILQNAEVLGPMVLSQLVNPGAPVVYGVLSTPTDMMTTIAPTAAPEVTGPIMRAGLQMAKFYGVPARMDAANTDSCVCDFQAGAESAFLFVNAVRSGSNIIAGLGSLESRGMGSLEKLVLDAELAEYVKAMLKPMEFTEDTMAVDLIKEMGRDANYIVSDHTLRHFREVYQPKIFQRNSYSVWSESGKKDSLMLASERVRGLLESYKKPDILPQSIVNDMEKYMLEKSGGQ